MNLVLLDTHVWVWLLNGDRKLNPKALKAIEQSLADEAVLLSAISPWEGRCWSAKAGSRWIGMWGNG